MNLYLILKKNNMRKFTLILAMACIGAILTAQPTTTALWEFSQAKGTLPTYIGTANACRGIGFGTFESEKVLVVPTRALASPAVLVLKASDGTQKASLNMTGVSGGTFAINDANITTDGKILVCNLANSATNNVFKVYQWNNSTDAPTVALQYTVPTADVTRRYGDYFNATGSITDGTAKIYASSYAVVSGTRDIRRFSMIADTNNPGSYVFNPVPDVFSIMPTYLSNSMASLAFFPNGTFAYKGPGEQVRKLYTNMALTGDTIPKNAISTFSISPEYVTTVGTSDYLACYNYGQPTEFASIVRINNGDWANATSVLTTPTLGTNANANGCGRVLADEDAGNLYLYVFGTNNGIAKYQINGIISGVNDIDIENIKIINQSGALSVEGVNASGIEVYNTLGQLVKSQINVNQINVGDLEGVYIIQIKADGKLAKTAKVIIN